jgi:hypothetical protein
VAFEQQRAVAQAAVSTLPLLSSVECAGRSALRRLPPQLDVKVFNGCTHFVPLYQNLGSTTDAEAAAYLQSLQLLVD